MLVDGLDHPECVAYGPDGFAYAGGEAGEIYRVDVSEAKVAVMGSTGGFLLGIALDAEANVYACDIAKKAVVRITQDGKTSVVSTGILSRPMVHPNYPVFDSRGMLYVSDSGVWPEGGGCIYRIHPNGETAVWATSCPQFTNGLALSADEGYLYVVESTLPGITRLPIGIDGRAGPVELVSSMPGTVPDGLAFDRDGRLYVGCYRPDRIYRIDPGNAPVIVADDFQGTALSAPTNLAFIGSTLDRLLIASLGRWHLSVMPVDIPGQPLHYPIFSASAGEGG
jgi:gluconolactonase